MGWGGRGVISLIIQEGRLEARTTSQWYQKDQPKKELSVAPGYFQQEAAIAPRKTQVAMDKGDEVEERQCSCPPLAD